jgi:hypothetical protein
MFESAINLPNQPHHPENGDKGPDNGPGNNIITIYIKRDKLTTSY